MIPFFSGKCTIPNQSTSSCTQHPQYTRNLLHTDVMWSTLHRVHTTVKTLNPAASYSSSTKEEVIRSIVGWASESQHSIDPPHHHHTHRIPISRGPRTTTAAHKTWCASHVQSHLAADFSTFVVRLPIACCRRLLFLLHPVDC